MEEHIADSPYPRSSFCLQIWASPSIAKIPEEKSGRTVLQDLGSAVGAMRSGATVPRSVDLELARPWSVEALP
jgi:hypothetical protein